MTTGAFQGVKPGYPTGFIGYPRSLVAAYDFEGLNGGKVIDKTANGNDLTVNGPWVHSLSKNSKFGKAYTKDATTSQYLEKASNAAFMPPTFTALAWIKNDVQEGTDRTIMGKQHAFGTSSWQMQTAGASNLLQLSTHDGTTTSVMDSAGIQNLTQGIWFHVGFTYDGNFGKMYINGILVKGPVAMVKPMTNGTEPFRIGLTGQGVNPFKGSIDEVYFFNEALDEKTIGRIMDNGVSGLSSKGLVLSLDMKTLTNDGKLMDWSGNGNHGTINNATKTTGLHDEAYDFNGSTGYITGPFTTPISSGPISIFAVFSQRTGVSGSYIVELDDNRSGGNTVTGAIRMGSSFWNLSWLWGTANGSTNTPNLNLEQDMVLNKWNKAVATYDGTTASLWLNGRLIERRPGTFTPTANAYGIGATASGAAKTDGRIDEVLVFNRLLSDEEILSLTRPSRVRVSEKGLVLSLDMETKVSGKYRDASGFGNHGTIVSGTSLTDVAAVPGKGTTFATHSDKIQIPNSPSLASLGSGSYTIAYWMQNYLATGGELRSTVRKGQGSVPGIRMSSTGTLSFMNLTTSRTFLNSDNRWHIVAVRDFDKKLDRVYVNGVLDTVISDTIGDVSNTSPIDIGENLGNTFGFVGDLDEIKIWNRALTEQEVIALAQPIIKKAGV